MLMIWLVYHSEIDAFDWNDNRIFDAWFDAYYVEGKSQYVQRCFREAVNTSEMLIHVENDGIISLASGETKIIKIAARDAAGNWSECDFRLVGAESKKQAAEMPVMAQDELHIVLGEGFFS